MTVYGLQVEVSVGNDSGEGALQRLSVAFERAGEYVADFGKYVFPRLTPVFEDAEVEQFDAEGSGPTSGAWAPLTPSYADWKNKVAPGMPILELTSKLRAALTQSASPVAYREWTASEFVFGTTGVEYASFHQRGTSRMKARPVFDFGPSFEDALTRAGLAGLREAVKDASNGTLELEGAP